MRVGQIKSSARFLGTKNKTQTCPQNTIHENGLRMVSITRLRMRPYRPYFLCARAPINSTSAGLAPCEKLKMAALEHSHGAR